MSKYINPYTDFGFKKLFGEDASKDLLIDFLNQLLPAHHQIADLTFKNVEHLPDINYEESRMSYLEVVEVKNTAEQDGMRKKEIEAVLGMHKIGLPVEKIAEALNITTDAVNHILKLPKSE